MAKNRAAATDSVPLLARLKFLTKVFWTKNAEPFSDDMIHTMKFNVIELTRLWVKFFAKYGGGTGKRIGIKFHQLIHAWEWCQKYRYSCGWCDDQRSEAFIQYIKHYSPLFEKFKGRINLKHMMDKLFRKFQMVWDCNNQNM